MGRRYLRSSQKSQSRWLHLTTTQIGASSNVLLRPELPSNKSNTYKDDSLRDTQAYSVQMSQDNSWVPNGRPQEFHFAVSSPDANLEAEQLNTIPSDIDMILLQTGSDKASLAEVYNSCVYAHIDIDVGPAYPDPSGMCYQAIKNATKYIEGPNRNQLFQDVQALVQATFQDEHVKNNSVFQLFVPGFFQPFYDQGGDGDWCDDVSFALGRKNSPNLTLELRKKMNELTRTLNDQITWAINGTGAQFINTDAVAKGHQFCQPGQTLYDQFYSEDIFLWNKAPEAVVFKAEAGVQIPGTNGTYEVRKPTPAEFEHWTEAGSFNDDHREVSLNTTVLAVPYLDEDAIAAERRAFHPNAKGNQAMAQTVMQFISAAYNNPNPQMSAMDYGKQTTSIQLQASMYANQFSWWGYRGPIGIAVNPCGDTRFQRMVWNQVDSRPDLKIEDPPFVRPGTLWILDLPEYKGSGRRCIYKASDTDSDPGQVTCGIWLVMDFKADPENMKEHKSIVCGSDTAYHNHAFHPAWLLEY
jgi:hypothetical protein